MTTPRLNGKGSLKFAATALSAALSAALSLGSLAACSSMQNKTDEKASSVANTAATAVNASNVAEVTFPKASAALSDQARTALNDIVTKAQANGGRIDAVKVAAWSDSEYPATSQKELSKGDRDLANQRAKAVKDYFQSQLKVKPVDTYNMAERPGTLSNLFNTSDTRLKQALESAGMSTTAAGGATTAKASQAVVMIILK